MRLKLGGEIRERIIVGTLLSPRNAKEIQNDYACTPRFNFVQQIPFTNDLKTVLKNIELELEFSILILLKKIRPHQLV